jgi:poly(beta-D-mannuronate) lyase
MYVQSLRIRAADLVTDGFYRLDDPTHSIIDPVRQEAYRKSSDGVKAVGLAVVNAADDYRTIGSRSAAQCAMAQTLTLAQEHSLAGKMSSNQAYYVQGWVVGAVAVTLHSNRGKCTMRPRYCTQIAEFRARLYSNRGQSGWERTPHRTIRSRLCA